MSTGSIPGTVVAARKLARQNRLIRKFRDAGALSPATAVTLEEIGVEDPKTLRRMVDKGVFIEAGDHRYYMDSKGMNTFLAWRLVRMIVTLIVLVVIFVLVNRR
jgi:hypothetical protein